MTKPFDMELFLGGVLTGSQATRKRHLRQATIIHAAIAERWQRKKPGFGKESIWLGFSIIAFVNAARRRGTTTC